MMLSRPKRFWCAPCSSGVLAAAATCSSSACSVGATAFSPDGGACVDIVGLEVVVRRQQVPPFTVAR
jgi:hypothetical protein